MSEYIFVTNIFEYSNIRIYSSHSALVHQMHTLNVFFRVSAFTNGSSPFSVGAIYINLNALVLCKCLKYSFIANRPVFTLSKYRDLRCTKLQQSVAVLTRAFVNV